MDYFETSAKENINIQEVMVYIMDKVYDNLYANADLDEPPQGNAPVDLNRHSHVKEAQGQGTDCKCLK